MRPHITLCPFSSPLLGSDLIFLHFTLHEREALVSAHRVSGHFTQLPLQTPRVRTAAWAALGTPWCLGISPHKGCIPSPTPHWVHKYLLVKLMELNFLVFQASFLRPERELSAWFLSTSLLHSRWPKAWNGQKSALSHRAETFGIWVI